MTSAPTSAVSARPVLPVAEYADGPYIYDTDGRRYLDGSSGVLNVNLGHAHPAVLSSIEAQLRRLTFVHRTQFRNTPAVELTARLLEIAPRGTAAVEYSNSGSEANECALRLAFAYVHRKGEAHRTVVLSEQPSYHGMTAAALSITGSPGKRDPSVEQLLRTPNADRILVRPSAGLRRATHEDWARALLAAGPSNVAAIVLEPLGGASSGASPISTETMHWLRRESRDNGIVLIADEVMSGFGRTGMWWACDHCGLAPDILTSGKGVTGGYTSLAVTLVSQTIVDGIGAPLAPIALGHTMSANPLACATAQAVLAVIESEGLIGNAAACGRLLAEKLAGICGRYPGLLTDESGLGLMRAVHCAPGPEGPRGRTIVAAAREHGVILCPSGIDVTTDSVLVAPPLTSTPELIEELAERLDRTMAAIAG